MYRNRQISVRQPIDRISCTHTYFILNKFESPKWIVVYNASSRYSLCYSLLYCRINFMFNIIIRSTIIFCNSNKEAQFQLYRIRYFHIHFELVKLPSFIYLSKYLGKSNVLLNDIYTMEKPIDLVAKQVKRTSNRRVKVQEKGVPLKTCDDHASTCSIFTWVNPGLIVCGKPLDTMHTAQRFYSLHV